MLEALPPLAKALSQPPLGSTSLNPTSSPKTSNCHYLSIFLSTLTPLTLIHPIYSRPMFNHCSPVYHRQGAFTFPPPDSSTPSTDEGVSSSPIEDEDDKDERSTLRLSALEFMVKLSEARPNMVHKVTGWTEVIVRACLEGMGELDEDETSGLEAWLREDVNYFYLRF